MNPKDRLIVALDVDTTEKAIGLIRLLKKEVRFFKIGLELFTSCGPKIVDAVKGEGGEIFLDLKLHDIPNTVAKASRAITRLGVFMFNVHASGGYDMVKAAADAVNDEAGRLKIARPRLIAVTVLTSMSSEDLKKVGVHGSAEEQVARLAAITRDAGADGVVASAVEAGAIRSKVGKDFVIVTPGVRPAWAGGDDQKRIATPKDAVSSGADFIVIGRPIVDARDPLEATGKILKEME